VAADYSCAEGAFGPGLATTAGCAGTVPDGAAIDTSAPGSHVFSVTATSQDGQAATASASYAVGYATSGFLPPVVTAVGGNPVINTGKAGRTYPLQWQLQDAAGDFIGTAGATLTYKPVTCGGWSSDATNAITMTATGGTSLRYDSAADQYIYNWKTPAASGCYEAFVTLDSGQVLQANFRLS
jgi:hypothetical protein